LISFAEEHMFPIGNMDIKNPKDLGAAIKATRKQLKVTQKELAMTCGTGLRFIIDLEKGKSTCHIGKTLQVINALGLHIHLSDTRRDTDLDENL
jgi:HTH-type transcriptional regulator/antitoxin HipB